MINVDYAARVTDPANADIKNPMRHGFDGRKFGSQKAGFMSRFSFLYIGIVVGVFYLMHLINNIKSF